MARSHHGAGGDENFNVYAIDPSQLADAATGTPPTRALTNYKGVRTMIYATPKAKPDTLYIGLNDRDPKWHDLYELSISTGEKKLLRKNTEQIAGWDFDHYGNLKLAERTNQAGDTEILRVDADGFKQIYSCSVLESCGVADFDATNKQVYLITNKGDVDLSEIEMLDPSTGSTKKYESDPANRVDVEGLALSDVDYHVYFTRYEDDRSRLYFKDKEFEKEYHWLESKLPGKEINFGARSKDESIWIVSAASDTEPGETYLWNRKAGTLDLQYRIREEMPRTSLYAKRVGIAGGSYGGYATLAGVAFTPDVYAAAVAIVAPSNLITLLDAIPTYWEAGRKQMYARMADPTTPHGKALLIAESPLTKAKDIVTPLMVVQGKNDPRVNIRESNQIVAAVRDNGKPVEYLVAPDEGHGFARPINNLAMVTAMEEFLPKYLGGRDRKDVPVDVEAKLKEITVDPKTVSGEVTLKGALAPGAK